VREEQRPKGRQTYLKRHDAGDVRDQPGDLEQHVGGDAVLLRLAVNLGGAEVVDVRPLARRARMPYHSATESTDLKPKLQVVRVGDLALGNEARDGVERVEACQADVSSAGALPRSRCCARRTLCRAPGQALGLDRILNVARGHVDGERWQTV
jgi:hypothetical protein